MVATGPEQFHNTLRETDENDDMHDVHEIPSRANMALHRFLSDLYTASTRPLLSSQPPLRTPFSLFTIPNSPINQPAPRPKGSLREAYGKLRVSVWEGEGPNLATAGTAGLRAGA